MSDPRTASLLYLAIIVVNLLFSESWGRLWAVLAKGTSDKAGSASTTTGAK